MKLTADYLKKLIRESLAQMEEGDVLHGKFGGKPSMDLGKAASVTQLHKGPEMPEGTEWLTDASNLVSEVMNNIDDIAKVDESLAERLFTLADKLSPIFKAGGETLGDLDETDWSSWKKAHGEEGSKYVSPSGEEHDDPWESSKEQEPEEEEEKD